MDSDELPIFKISHTSPHPSTTSILYVDHGWVHRIHEPGCPLPRRRFRVIDALVARRLVAATLPARDRAAVVPFNRGSHHAAVLPWADGDTTCADANCDVVVVPPAVPIVAVAAVPIVAVVAVPPDLNIDALGHLDALGLSRSGEGSSRQHRRGCRQGESDLHHVGVLLGLDLEVQRARTLRVPPGRSRGGWSGFVAKRIPGQSR